MGGHGGGWGAVLQWAVCVCVCLPVCLGLVSRQGPCPPPLFIPCTPFFKATGLSLQLLANSQASED